MNKIVTKGIKVDLHIHSCFSHKKDDSSLIGNNTIKNASKFLHVLKENQLNLFSITDHDYFSYNLYSELKKLCKSELKILPGVEFTIGIDDFGKTKNIHVIAIFDDNDEEKIKLIEKHLNQQEYDSKIKSFTENKFRDILKSINLNVILIAHQKGSLYSKKTPLNNDLRTLSDPKINEFINAEYFDSLEFKNEKNGIFNRLFAKEKNDNYNIVRFITGSDCHDWNVYPKHDKNESNDIDYRPTFLKCLPTFEGLRLALSDYSRIKNENSFFSISEKYLKSIELIVEGKDVSIPLSKGINAIIGDNSIGKSLLLNKIFKQKSKSIDQENGYKFFLEENNITIKDNLTDEQIASYVNYDEQGKIRKSFLEGTQDHSAFLNSKFPSDPDLSIYRDRINNVFNEFYEAIKNKLLYDEELTKLNQINLLTKFLPQNVLNIKQIKSKIKTKDIKKIIAFLDKIIALINNNSNVINLLDNNGKSEIETLKIKIEQIRKKYKNNFDCLVYTQNIQNCINDGIKDFRANYDKFKSDYDKEIESQTDNISTLCATIFNLITYKSKIVDFKYDEKNNFEIQVEENKINDYIFTKRPKGFYGLNKSYFDSLLSRITIKNSETINTSTITKDQLSKILKNNILPEKNRQQLTEFELLKSNIEKCLNDDFAIEPCIFLKTDKVNLYTKYSNGMNSTIYFDILSGDNREGIYAIDQPEDDVSQNSIHEYLIKYFKKMAQKKQIILITHNPQFVVNMDADNVICLEHNRDTKSKGKIVFTSGALEYDNILSKVASNLEGGIDSIKQRWKKYNKEEIK